jgi:hypothetical protein
MCGYVGGSVSYRGPSSISVSLVCSWWARALFLVSTTIVVLKRSYDKKCQISKLTFWPDICMIKLFTTFNVVWRCNFFITIPID